jgi:hypothetical protein
MGVIQDMYLDDTHKGREVFSKEFAPGFGGWHHARGGKG